MTFEKTDFSYFLQLLQVVYSVNIITTILESGFISRLGRV